MLLMSLWREGLIVESIKSPLDYFFLFIFDLYWLLATDGAAIQVCL